MDTAFPRSITLLTAKAIASSATPRVMHPLAALPWPARFAIADVFAQIHAGEEAALQSIRRVAKEDPIPEARAFAELQLRDELAHVHFFADAGRALGVQRRPMVELQRLFERACSAPSLPELLLANHLVVETLAHELFRDVAGVFRQLANLWCLPRGWRLALSSLGDGMAIIFQDESRHVAFGVLRLRALRGTLNEAERVQFDRMAHEWGTYLEHTLAGLPVSPLLRRWFRSRARTIVRQYRQRCADVGVRS